jgi:hypothetical protein
MITDIIKDFVLKIKENGVSAVVTLRGGGGDVDFQFSFVDFLELIESGGEYYLVAWLPDWAYKAQPPMVQVMLIKDAMPTEFGLEVTSKRGRVVKMRLDELVPLVDDQEIELRKAYKAKKKIDSKQFQFAESYYRRYIAEQVREL